MEIDRWMDGWMDRAWIIRSNTFIYIDRSGGIEVCITIDGRDQKSQLDGNISGIQSRWGYNYKFC